MVSRRRCTRRPSISKPVAPAWHVYILRCADGTLYTGIALDPARRLREHNEDNALGARYTRARRPVELMYVETLASRAEAAQREYAIKRLDRAAKLALIDGSSTAPRP